MLSKPVLIRSVECGGTPAESAGNALSGEVNDSTEADAVSGPSGIGGEHQPRIIRV